MKRISPINPIARAVALSRRRASVVPPKKGKGSFNRKKLPPVIEDYKGYKGNQYYLLLSLLSFSFSKEDYTPGKFSCQGENKIDILDYVLYDAIYVGVRFIRNAKFNFCQVMKG